MQVLFGCLSMLVVFSLSCAYMIAGFLGLEDWLGTGWAWAAVAGMLFLRIGFPFTLGVFFFAKDVWHWHWAGALLLAAPGLVLILPAFVSGILGWATAFYRDHGPGARARRAADEKAYQDQMARLNQSVGTLGEED